MIQTLTFRIRSADERKVEDLARRVERMVSLRKDVLGAEVLREGETVALRMRMSMLDRWKISATAKQVASFMFAAAGFQFSRPLQPELIVTELTRNKLRDGEGRTPRVRPPRAVMVDQVA